MVNPGYKNMSGNRMLALLLLVLMLPFLSAIYLLDTRFELQSQFIARQKTGIDYIKSLGSVLEHIQQHRGMSNARRSGAHEFDSPLSELGAELDREIQELENRYDRFGIIPRKGKKSMQWYARWLKLQQQQGGVTAEDDFDAHSMLISEYLGSLQDVAEAFSLMLDTDLKTRYLTEAIMRLPAQLENIAQMRGLGAGFVARAQMGKMEEKRLFSLGNIVSVEMESLVRDMNVLFRHDATLESRMTPILEQSIDGTNRFLMMTYRELIESDALSISAAAYFAAGTATLNNFYSLFDAIHNELEAALVSRLADIRYKRILLWASSLLAVLVMVMIYYMFLRQQKKRQRLWWELQESHEQLLQSEKLASIGQLAAGVAHEINNPVGYVYSNLGTLQEYTDGLCQMLEGYENLESLVADDEPELQRLRDLKNRLDVDYIKDDVRNLVSESREGIARVKGIVQDLKDFSHVDEAEWQWADLHRGLDSTLNIVNNEIKYKAKVIREYGDLPLVECLASQLNQVFMNLLVNAAHAIEEQGTITIRTGMQGEHKVWVEISDTGSGISAENKKKIFDPFFTTKGVGKGTGLGLSLSYGIVHKHGGHIRVDSEIDKGTTFRISLPVSRPNQEQKKDSA